MSMRRIGFIGAGNMTEALLRGLIGSGTASSDDITVSDVSSDRSKHMKNEFGVDLSKSNKEVAMKSDIIVLAVKPNKVRQVASEIRDYMTPNKMIVSIAAGIPLSELEKVLKKKTKIVRVMPNTPASAKAGVSVLSPNKNVTAKELKKVEGLFESVGFVHVADENLMDAVTGLSGSGPAFVSVFIEALSDGGVKMGLPRDVALKLAAHTVYGTAKMILEHDIHPAEFKDKVSSPGGTTIEGLHSLEGGGFRAVAISAVEAATNRSKELSEED